MTENRIRVLGIAPYDGMRTAMEHAAEGYPLLQLDAYTGDLKEGVAIVREIPANTYSCIISRGGTAAMIRKVTDIPVVEITISVYDVMRTMKLAQNYSHKYAVVGFPGITEPAHTVSSLLGCDLNIVTIHNSSEAETVLNRLKDEGYTMVVCDMVNHTVARQLGLDAFLITSGMESIQTALDQALSISQWYGKQRKEINILRKITQGQNGRAIELNGDGSVHYSSPSDPPQELLVALRKKLNEVPRNGIMKFYLTEHDQLYSISAQIYLEDGRQRYLFYCVPSRIPLHTNWTGIRTMNRGECEYLFNNSFYSLSGAMGTFAGEITMLSGSRQSVMISGERGTGKEQIARYLYLHNPLVNRPLVQVDCSVMNDRSWDFLLNHYNSPLNSTGETVYFQNLETMPDSIAKELMSGIEETGLSRRVRLIFSCSIIEGQPVPAIMRTFMERLGCFSLTLPALRSRQEEIPSLASLYLNSLNLDLGKQISGFEPKAVEMLCRYSWPTNYSQFKNVLQTLATLTTSSYISSTLVAELLSKERALSRVGSCNIPVKGNTSTLDEIIMSVIQETVVAAGGNRAQAARQLGISRTTLWRYLARIEEENNKGQ